MTYAGRAYAGPVGLLSDVETAPHGTLNGTLPSFMGELTGVSEIPAAGTLDATLPSFDGDLLGQVSATAQVVGTDQLFENLSYSYGGTSWAEWETDLAAPPWETS